MDVKLDAGALVIRQVVNRDEFLPMPQHLSQPDFRPRFGHGRGGLRRVEVYSTIAAFETVSSRSHSDVIAAFTATTSSELGRWHPVHVSEPVISCHRMSVRVAGNRVAMY